MPTYDDFVKAMQDAYHRYSFGNLSPGTDIAPPQERTCDNKKHSEGCECLKLFYPDK